MLGSNTSTAGRPNGFYARIGKRLFDGTVALFILILLSPLFLLIALTLKLFSPGPVFFKQRRIGRRGRPFVVYKFRSMHPNSENSSNHITSADDPRITRVGRYLRRWKLDEFPQLMNVLKGEMSLVGPRPQVFQKIQRLTEVEKQVLECLPGLTGLSALCDRREEEQLVGIEDMEKTYTEKWFGRKMQQELYYVQNLSFLLDVKLILITAILLYFPGTSAAKTIHILGQQFNPYSGTMKMCVDGVIYALALTLAYLVRYEPTFEPGYQEQLCIFVLIVPISRVAVGWALGVYKLAWRYVSLSDVGEVVGAQVPVSAVLLALRLLLNPACASAVLFMMPLSIVTGEFLLSTFGVLSARAVRFFFHRTEIRFRPPRTALHRRFLLVGAGHHGAALARRILLYPQFEAVGFVDDDPLKQHSRISSLMVLGTVARIPEISSQYGVEEILVCADGECEHLAQRVKEICGPSSLPIRVVPDLLSVLSNNGSDAIT